MSSAVVNRYHGFGVLQYSNLTSTFTSPNRRFSTSSLPPKLRRYLEDTIKQCLPSDIHLCDGSEQENKLFIEKMLNEKTILPLPKYRNCYLARTDPRDVARVESRTFICTRKKRDAIPEPAVGVVGKLGNWISIEDMDAAVDKRFTGCMKGRTMYIIPFSMGPIDSPLAKMGIQVTDSTYVAASMRIMTRMGREVAQRMNETNQDEIVLAKHSVGVPIDHYGPNVNSSWPCNPQQTLILHKPETNEIVSFGSGYGGNSLLGKKCFALRIGSTIARKEGWLAEHMLILGITPPNGKKKYICAAFPSACGKTNLAMLTPTIPGYKVECVGDDIAWIKFNPKTKMFHAINPENGFFGVAAGTCWKTNPMAMATIFKDTLFTNVGETSDGGVWWEGMEPLAANVSIKSDWQGQPYTGQSVAHPNSRFTSPAKNLPIIDANWDSSEGVPISAILFGGRRPEGVPLVYQSYSWEHGVLIGAMMRSESTAAAEHKGKQIMNDPFAMRPFFGYNFGQYLEHWLSMPQIHKDVQLPKIFHVNWFRKGLDGKWLWPGFGDNVRVLDWILRRTESDNDLIANETPIGHVPSTGSLNIEGLSNFNLKESLSVPKQFWLNEVSECEKYFSEQIPNDIPEKIVQELKSLKIRIHNFKETDN